MKRRSRVFSAASILIAATLGSPSAYAQYLPTTDAPPPRMPTGLTEYQTRYYKVFSDLDPIRAREACIRMTKMAEEYHSRTSQFAGDIREKLPFYLFKSAEEYYDAGGMPKSAGVFNGTRLMAMADPMVGKQVWHVVQHEGFHQFLHAVIGGQVPIWVNEGMAEYFGEGIFTGDGFVIGIIPPWRLARIKKTLASKSGEGGFKSIASMTRLSHGEWNAEMNIENYDQAWSMVHFLAHGDGGKYQHPFEDYMRLISRGQEPTAAWNQVFGNDNAGFERQWKSWWTNLDENPTSDLYARATVATLTSFLSRAINQKQTFDSFDAFEKVAESGLLRSTTNQWLPPSLLESVLRDVAHRQDAGEKFSFNTIGGKKIIGIVDETNEGLKVAGAAVFDGDDIRQVNVTISGTKHPIAQKND